MQLTLSRCRICRYRISVYSSVERKRREDGGEGDVSSQLEEGFAEVDVSRQKIENVPGREFSLREPQPIGRPLKRESPGGI